MRRRIGIAFLMLGFLNILWGQSVDSVQIHKTPTKDSVASAVKESVPSAQASPGRVVLDSAIKKKKKVNKDSLSAAVQSQVSHDSTDNEKTKLDSAMVQKDSLLETAQDQVTYDSTGKEKAKLDSAMVQKESAIDTSDSWGSALGSSSDSLLDSTASQNSSAKAQDSAAANQENAKQPLLSDEDEYQAKKPKRKNVFKQSRINTIDEIKGKYKSPKKAMFMSFLVPGLGQAYVGSYIRSALYVMVEGGLILGWRHFVVTKHNRQVKKYRRYAAEHWQHQIYEQKLDEWSNEQNYADPVELLKGLPTRDQYCNAIFAEDPEIGSRSQTCRDLGPYIGADEYKGFSFYSFLTQYEHHDFGDPKDTDEIIQFRENNFQDVRTFYEIIGKHNEYLPGWDDVDSLEIIDQSGNEPIAQTFIRGISENRDEYRSMRAKATEYSRMQSIFLGYIVLNHVVSALDAALTAKFHNKKLYETEVKWYDRIELRSFLAFGNQGLAPVVQAYLPF